MSAVFWRAALLGTILGGLALGVGCNALVKSRPAGEPGEYEECEGLAPTARVALNPTVHGLACDLDHLERHIDWYGSVTAKSPDVWGQARLTQYREEFEAEMVKDLPNFKVVVSGSQARSDQAYFASATALALAVQPQPPAVGRVNSTRTVAPGLLPTEQYTERVSEDKTTGTRTTVKTTEKPPDIQEEPGKLISEPDKVIKRTDVQLTKLGFQGVSGGVIGLEPSEMLAQKKRYLDLLNQIRRENEGDDTADSPGYSLNLLRIPVSVLPGKRTDVGHGAEITMTLTPVLGDDLLPMTFRNLLVNDLSIQLGFPLTQVLNEEPNEQGVSQFLHPLFKRFVHTITRLNDYLADPDTEEGNRRLDAFVKYLNTDPKGEDHRSLQQYATDEIKRELANLGIECLRLENGVTLVPSQREKSNARRSTGKRQAATFRQMADVVSRVGGQIARGFAVPSLSFANGLDNKTAFPTSQLLDVYGWQMAFDIAFGARQAFARSIDQQGYAHLPDIQGYLKEETRAAYQFLAKNPQLWQLYCTPELVRAIRSQQWEDVTKVRQCFRRNVALLTRSEPAEAGKFDPSVEPAHLSRTTALAWGLIVDAALLTDRLMLDMKETASAKGKPLPGCEGWCPYFLPDPPPECRRTFNEYVALRWPIHVFALDPYVQEQNIADALSTRRETQLALAIAFTNGLISARNMTRFVRRLEAEYETLALNRTQVGFSHGENVFGWRFYPRFQTPDTPSNAEVLIREQLIGGPNRDALLRQRRLEPGPRECVAVVLMPSFVPYVMLDTVSNWFPLTNPKRKLLDHTQAMKLSRKVQAIKNSECGVRDAQKYRPGELERLLRRAGQLEARLPTQTLITSVPLLNTLGGFEMFANGTTDLAPELYGWYGAPGIDPDAESTTLFLVGDHFSPLRTKVIVGNMKVADQKLLSRQVLQVTFGKPLYALGGPNGKEVRIHLATPYGVTRELAVPWIKQKPADPAPKVGFSFGDARLIVRYGIGEVKKPEGVDPNLFRPIPCDAENKELKLSWVAPGGMLSAEVKIACTFEFTAAGITLPCQVEAKGEIRDRWVVIAGTELNRLAQHLIEQIGKAGPFSRINNPLTALKSKKVTVTPAVPQGIKAQSVETTDPLTVEFKAAAICVAPPMSRPEN